MLPHRNISLNNYPQMKIPTQELRIPSERLKMGKDFWVFVETQHKNKKRPIKEGKTIVLHYPCHPSRKPKQCGS